VVYDVIPPTAATYLSATATEVQPAQATTLLLARAESPGDSSDAQKSLSKFPLLICLHGTDESAFDGELFQHEDGLTTWLDVSDAEQAIVIFPQSRGQWATENQRSTSWRDQGDWVRTLWIDRPVDAEFESDLQFLTQVVEDVSNSGGLFTNAIVDKTRVYVIGFSNGGFQACDLALASRRGEFTSLAGVCFYMGGVLKQQLAREKLKEEELPGASRCIDLCEQRKVDPACRGPPLTQDQSAAKPALEPSPVTSAPQEPSMAEDVERKREAAVAKSANTRVLVVSADGDMQMFSSCLAWQLFLHLGYKTGFRWLTGCGHEYQSSSTEFIWKFFQS